MPKCRVAVIGPREAETQLRAALSEVEFCGDAESPDVRVVWLSGDSLSQTGSARNAYNAARTFYVHDVTTFDHFTKLFDTAQLFHLRGTRELDLRRLSRDIAWACEPHVPTWEELTDEPCVSTWRVATSTQLDGVMTELNHALEKDNANPRIVAQFCDAAGELLTNAVYNAPVDKHGDPMFRFRSREVAVTLPNQDVVEVRLCRSPARFLLSIKDPYGSLSTTRVIESLRRAHRRNDRQVQPTPGGAGVGMMVALNNVSSLTYCLRPGKSTEVIVSSDITPTFREFQQRPRSFSLWA